jgi:metal-responsive CopG/Arc/MetJ family transcriptional regulator
MEKTADIHLILSESLLADLDQQARERGVRRAQLLREALAEYLDRIESQRIDREMSDYADALAPSSGEFVSETDAHTVHRLLDETEW